MDSDAIFEQLTRAVLATGRVSERWVQFSTTLQALGFDQINYGYIDPSHADREKAPVRFLSSMQGSWINYYGDKRFDKDDPHVKLVRSGNLTPYVWTTSRLVTLEEAGERRVLLEAQEAGLINQLQVTLPDMDGRGMAVAGMALGTSLNEREFSRIVKPVQTALILAAHLFHQNSAAEIERECYGIHPLSDRERDCLIYIAIGQRITQIASRTGLAEVTVGMHLARARRKMKAATLAQAVAKALRLHLIRI